MAIWYIWNDIPYLKEFPPLIAPGALPPKKYYWYIATDIPYLKEFIDIIPLGTKPAYPKNWWIDDTIPYQKTYPPFESLSYKPLYPKIWWIDEDIPYLKEYIPIEPLGHKPDYPKIWWINDTIPYLKEYIPFEPLAYKPLYPKIWWINTDIPYLKEYPELIPLGAPPPYEKIWHILTDIPYIVTYPPFYPLSPLPVPRVMYYYTIGTAAVGRWQIRCTAMTEELPPPEEWTLIEDIGPPSAVMSACIESDGDFDYKAGDESITLTTTDTPWMAVITTTKKLYVKQVCADITTAILLDTDVEQASLCRGWKSDKYGVDSGLICAYRKQNGVFAKVYKKVNGEYAWETLPQLLYEHVDHVEVKRLNDYRIGIYVTNPNRLLLSERFYIGGTSKTEYISVKLKPWANVCSFSMVGEPAEQTFKVVRCYMEDDTTVRMHCNYPIVSFDPDYPNLTLTDDYNYSKLVTYYIQNGDLVCILDKPKYSSFNTIRIVIPSINHILYEITPQFKRTIPGGEYAVENPPIAEYLNTTLMMSATTLRMTERKDYSVITDDYIATTIRVSSTIISTTEVHNYVNDTTSDYIRTTLIVSSTTLTMTQSGDLPI